MTIQNFEVTVKAPNGQKQRYTTAATSNTAAIMFVCHTYGYSLDKVCKAKPLGVR